MENKYSDEVVLGLVEAFSRSVQKIVSVAEILDKDFLEPRQKLNSVGMITWDKFKEVEEYMNLRDPEKSQLRELRDRVLKPIKASLSERRK